MAVKMINLVFKGVYKMFYEGQEEDKVIISEDPDSGIQYYCRIDQGYLSSSSSKPDLVGETMLVADAEADGFTFELDNSGNGSPDDEFEDGDFVKFKLPVMYAGIVDFPAEFDDCYVGQIKNTNTTYAFVQMYHADGKMGPRIPFFNLAGKVTITKLDYYPIPKSLVDVRLARHEDPDDPESPIILDEHSEIVAIVEVGTGERPAVGEPYVLPSTPQIDLVAAVYSDGSFEVIDEADYSVTPVAGDTVTMVGDKVELPPYVPGTFTYEGFEKKLYVLI